METAELERAVESSSGSSGGRTYDRYEEGDPRGGQFAPKGTSGSGRSPLTSGRPYVVKPKGGGGGSAPTAPRASSKFKTLAVGEDNDPQAVAELQQLLTALGLGNLSSGTYDKDTEAAVMEAQRRLGIKKPNGKASKALINKMLAAYDLSPCVKRSESLAEAVERGRSYPGQKYRHGWIPIAGPDLISEDQAAQDYGDELDRVEVGDACIVARSEGMLTVQTDHPDGVHVHASASPHQAAQWADHIDAVRDGDPGGRDVDGLRVHRGESDELMLRWVDDPDAPAHPGVDLDDDEADEFSAGLRDMAYVTHDNATPPDDADQYVDEFPADDLESARAVGADVTPGHDELHHFWTRGKGLKEWAGSPRPWTTLVGLLTKHVGPEKAKIFASRWFIEVFGYAAGSDKNRVAHGKPPRGHRVGPG